MKQRISYLDVARGLAILLVIFYHVPLYIRICHPGAGDLVQPHIDAGTYILPFFMPVFFVISGFFTDTSKSYGRFLWGDVKNLLLVGLFLQLVNTLIQTIGLRDMGILKWFVCTLFSAHGLDILFSQWFISAIFFARQVYYAIDRLSGYVSCGRKGVYWLVELTALILIAIVCILMEPHAPHNSQWFYCQGGVFAIFIACGALLRAFSISKWWLLGGGCLYILLMVISRFTGISTLEYGMVNSAFTLAHWPYYMLLALSGSSLLIALAQLINRFTPLEFIGRHSLIYYVPQGGILVVCTKLLGRFFPLETPTHVWGYILIMWGATLLGLTLLSAIPDIVKKIACLVRDRWKN